MVFLGYNHDALLMSIFSSHIEDVLIFSALGYVLVIYKSAELYINSLR